MPRGAGGAGTNPSGFRLYPPGERPDVQVRVDAAERDPLLVAQLVWLEGELQLAPRRR